jgi:hypothetical protein
MSKPRRSRQGREARSCGPDFEQSLLAGVALQCHDEPLKLPVFAVISSLSETGFRSFDIQEEKRCIMADGKKDPAGSPQQPADKSRADEAAVTERLEKEADEMAGKGRKREEQYDEDHDIFTK